MRILQIVVQKTIALAVLAAGVYIFVVQSGYWTDAPRFAMPQNPVAVYTIAIMLILLGLIALLPALRFGRKKSTISFPGEHGDVLIHLDSVEANLNKVVGKRPEVKRSHVALLPVADKRRVRLEADVVLIKTPNAGTRDLAENLRKFISNTAANMLGIDEIATVDLNVRGIVVDRSTVHAMVSKDAEPVPAAKPPALEAKESKPAAAAAAQPDLAPALPAAQGEAVSQPPLDYIAAPAPTPAPAPETIVPDEPEEKPIPAWHDFDSGDRQEPGHVASNTHESVPKEEKPETSEKEPHDATFFTQP